MYRIAYDYEPENPNPHELTLSGHAPFATYEEAVAAAEAGDRSQIEVEGYDESELTPWVIVSDSINRL